MAIKFHIIISANAACVCACRHAWDYVNKSYSKKLHFEEMKRNRELYINLCNDTNVIIVHYTDLNESNLHPSRSIFHCVNN